MENNNLEELKKEYEKARRRVLFTYVVSFISVFASALGMLLAFLD